MLKILEYLSSSLTFAQQIFNALVDMRHPFLFFSASRSVNCEWLWCRPNEPAVTSIFDTFKSVFFQSKSNQNSRGVSSSPWSWTSSSGMMCCLLYFFLPMMMLPYTRMSLKRKNCLGFGRLRHIFVRTPSPTRTRPGMSNCSPELPKQLSTICILRALASLFTGMRKGKGV